MELTLSAEPLSLLDRTALQRFGGTGGPTTRGEQVFGIGGFGTEVSATPALLLWLL